MWLYSPKQKNPFTRGPSTCAIQTVIPVRKERYFDAGTPPILHEASNTNDSGSLSDAIIKSNLSRQQYDDIAYCSIGCVTCVCVFFYFYLVPTQSLSLTLSHGRATATAYRSSFSSIVNIICFILIVVFRGWSKTTTTSWFIATATTSIQRRLHLLG